MSDTESTDHADRAAVARTSPIAALATPPRDHVTAAAAAAAVVEGDEGGGAGPGTPVTPVVAAAAAPTTPVAVAHPPLTHDDRGNIGLLCEIFPGVDHNAIVEAYNLARRYSEHDLVNRVTQMIVERMADGTAAWGDHGTPTHPGGPAGRRVSRLASVQAIDPDLLALVEIFPDLDRTFLYGKLREYGDHPNRRRLVSEFVFDHPDEVVRLAGVASTGAIGGDGPATAAAAAAAASPGRRLNRQSSVLSVADQVSIDLEEVMSAFPDADPNWIYARLEGMRDNEDRLLILSNEMIEKRNYPKRPDPRKKAAKGALKRTLSQYTTDDVDWSIDYLDISREVTENYKEHALIYLQNTFPMTPKGFIRTTLETCQSHLLPALRVLEDEEQLLELPVAERLGRRPTYRKLKNPRPVIAFPAEPCDEFFREVVYAANEERIKRQRFDEEAAKKLRLEEATARGELIECGCCYMENLFEDNAQCSEAHLFCLECCKRAAGVIIGSGGVEFPCMSVDGCTGTFPLSEAKRFLEESVFQGVERRIADREVRAAGLDNLVDCPFCDFAIIMENPDDKVLRCRNPECLKESCRLCGEENHIPLRCEEVEKDHEIAFRTFLEEHMTQSLLRKCWKCETPFFKTEGCNKMTCPKCHSYMCYVCSEPLDHGSPYNHFREGSCKQSVNTNALNEKNVRDGAKAALAEYIRLHPEAKGLELKHDPTAGIIKKKSTRKRKASGAKGRSRKRTRREPAAAAAAAGGAARGRRGRRR